MGVKGWVLLSLFGLKSRYSLQKQGMFCSWKYEKYYSCNTGHVQGKRDSRRLSHIGILPSIIISSITGKAMQNPDHYFQKLMKKTREAAVLDKQTSPSSPAHPLPAQRCHGPACSAAFTAHVESLFFTVQQLLPVIFMKSHWILKTTHPCPQPSTGVLQRHSRGSKFISVCRGGAKPFVFLTGSYTQSLSTKQLSLHRLSWEKGPKG